MENSKIYGEKNTINKKKIYKRAIIGIVILLLIIISIIGYNLFMNYIISEANKNSAEDEYDKAKQYYQIELKYSIGMDKGIQTKIQLCDSLQASLNRFNEGTDLLNNKKYIEAINAFKGVIPEDEKRFNIAKDKIVESRDLYLEDKFSKAEAFKSNNDYTSAIETINSILNFDPNNEKAKTLLAQYEADLKAVQAAAKAKEEAERTAQSKAKTEANSNAFSEANLRVAIEGMVRRGVSDDAINEWLNIISSRYGYKVDNLYR